VLMALAQVRLLPVYAKLRFSPGFWAFTFSYAAAVTYGLEWATRAQPPGATAYVGVGIVAITVFIAAIAVRTVVAAARGRLFPGSAP
jgi:tellurite resistance protein